MIPLIPWRPGNRDDALLPAKREGPIAFWGSSGVCVGCCLGEDANLAAAPLVQSLFFRPRGRWPPRGRRRHVMVVEALVPPDAARVATSGATVYTSAPDEPIQPANEVYQLFGVEVPTSVPIRGGSLAVDPPRVTPRLFRPPKRRVRKRRGRLADTGAAAKS